MARSHEVVNINDEAERVKGHVYTSTESRRSSPRCRSHTSTDKTSRKGLLLAYAEYTRHASGAAIKPPSLVRLVITHPGVVAGRMMKCSISPSSTNSRNAPSATSPDDTHGLAATHCVLLPDVPSG